MKPTPRAGSIASAPPSKLLEVLVLLLALVAVTLQAANVRVQWNNNPETDLAGYVVRWGLVGSTNTNSVPVETNSTTVSNLTLGSYYWFYVVAYNRAGLTSGPSEIVLSSIISPVQNLKLGPAP